jgi:pimeloyl-ACP methyl ester carboxylesterase
VLPPPQKPGEYLPAACRFVLPRELVEGRDVECGYLTVPEQRTQDSLQTGRLIRLAVAVFHPPGGANYPDPVIFLAGGPGFSALEAMYYQYDALSEAPFAAGRDLVVFDQRGIGLSQPALDCPGYDRFALESLRRQAEEQALDDQQMLELTLEQLALCRDTLTGIADLSAYHTAASAADVNDLRTALGYDQVNLWGGSYGSRLALEAMRRNPEMLRSVVLEAIYPPDVDLYLSAPANFQHSLERMFTSCAENPVCSQSYPNLRQAFYDTVAGLNAQPVVREIWDPASGEKIQARLDGATLLGLTFQLLYDSKIRYLLPEYITAASQGEFTAYDHIREAILAQLKYSSRGMMFSVQCHEEIPFSSLEDFHAEVAKYPELESFYRRSLLGTLTYRACQSWGAGAAEDSANQPVYSDVPTLLFSGEFDPITPPAWGAHAASTLVNSYHYEFPGIGHGASALSGCPRQMVAEFLNSPNTAPDASCIAEMLNP